MDRRYKIKVWKDRMAAVYPAKWCWEVVERGSCGKVLGCGTTFSEKKSQEAAALVVECRQAQLRERLAARGSGRMRLGFAASSTAAFMEGSASRRLDF